MKTILVACGEAPCSVEATAVICGRDITVCFGGGDSPHIGAVALGTPRLSLSDYAMVSASASVLCVTGHKEDQLAREAALRLAAGFQRTVTVTVGLHVDDASPDDIASLKANYGAALDEMERRLKTIACSGVPVAP